MSKQYVHYCVSILYTLNVHMYEMLYTSDLSSVGRAEDCSSCRISLGHWFESGRSEMF